MKSFPDLLSTDETFAMRMNIIRSLLAVLLLGALAGCGSMPLGKADRGTVLEAALNNYRKLIRWGYYDEAAKYLRTPDGQPIAADLKTAARYRVTNYTVSNSIVADDNKEARVIAAIEYYELDSGVIHLLHDAQMWWYDATGKRWYLASPLPHFGVEDEDMPPPTAIAPAAPVVPPTHNTPPASSAPPVSRR
ncbi:MAG: hypothetical protein IT492_08425 [Gammaproteobacteria bacterium]|nr:hypothetical protein [Gammaproteobacteria bacterium]